MTKDSNKKKIIIIISNEPWGDIWYIKHRYAYELSKQNQLVYFLNPTSKWRLSNLFSFEVKINVVVPNLYVVSYSNNLPLRILPKLFLRINDFLNSWKLKKNITSLSTFIFWQFDHLRFVNFHFFKQKKRIYHVADPYYQAPNNRSIAKKVDLIICTSKKYLPFYAEYKKVIHIPHVISNDEFQLDVELISSLRKTHGKFLVYTGQIDKSLNLDLIDSLLHNGIKLLLIGPNNLADEQLNHWKRLNKLPNLIYLGPKPGNELKNYLNASMGGLVMYAFELQNTIRSPLKILQYIAQFKPVISSFDPDIENYAELGIHFAKDEHSFLQLAQKAIREGLPTFQNNIEQYFSEMNYSSSINTILNAIGDQ